MAIKRAATGCRRGKSDSIRQPTGHRGQAVEQFRAESSPIEGNSLPSRQERTGPDLGLALAWE
jgi:hypothetical protein